MTDYRDGDSPNYQYGRATLEVYRGGKLIRTMQPEKRFYKASDGQSTTEVALYSKPLEDLYVVFAGASNDGKRYEITAHLNPLVWWVWFGAAVMVVGTLITLLPDRRISFATAQLSAAEAAAVETGVQAK
jgi:cytochrome c-type biogenesis protein CcmF